MKNIKLFLAIFGLVFAFAFSISAQNITFKSIDGESIDLEAQKGKVVVMAIGASWLYWLTITGSSSSENDHPPLHTLY